MEQVRARTLFIPLTEDQGVIPTCRLAPTVMAGRSGCVSLPHHADAIPRGQLGLNL